MGCWNATCAISNLPIFDYEEVYALMLAQSPRPDPDNFCYCTTLWQPFGFYFKGLYDGYGRLVDCTGDMLEQNIELLKTNLVEIDQGENQYHDIPVKKDTLDIKSIFEANHKDRLFIVNQLGHYTAAKPSRSVKIIFIKQNIFDGIINKWNPEEPFLDDNREMQYTTYDDRIIKDLEKWKESLKSELYISSFDMPLRGPEGTYNFNFMINLFQWAAKHEDPIKWSKICNNAKAVSKLSFFMDNNRQLWVPPCGSGSQNIETDTHELMLDLKKKEIKKIKKWFDA